jgi:hypothetical protein
MTDIGVADDSMLTEDNTDGSLLSFDKKKQLVEKYNFLEHAKVGTFVDAIDSTNSFILGKILKIEEVTGKGYQLVIGFDGWSEKWNMVSK